MKKIVNVLMNRDGLTKKEAEKEVRDGMKSVREMIAEGNFSGAEYEFSSRFGLEPDYLLNALI